MSIRIYEEIELGIEGNVAIITLRRPRAMNAMSLTLLQEFIDALKTVETSESIRALLITGEGKGFCAGADLSRADFSFDANARQAQGDATRQEMEDFFNPLASSLFHLTKPTVAAVNGAAAGAGMSIALACDLVFAAESAYFMQVFVPKLGIIPDLGSTWLLPRLIGNARARATMLLGERITASQAEDWGMIYQCTTDDELLDVAKTATAKLAGSATFGIAKLKQALIAQDSNSFAEQLQKEAEIQHECCASSDFVEGVSAFFEKRSPAFTGQKDASEAEYKK